MRRNLAPGCISSDVKLCQRKPLFLFFRGPLFLGPLVFFFLFFLSPAKVGSLEMQPGAKLQAYLGVIHACTQRFRLRILRRTRSNAGRVLGASQVEYKPFGKRPLKRETSSLEFGGRNVSEHYLPVFGGKRANLEARAAHLTPDTKNALFGVRRFRRFLLQKRSGDEAATSLVTSSAGCKLCSFGAFCDQSFLPTSCAAGRCCRRS